MSFRVLAVCIYSRHLQERRDISFNRNGLSIITGVSRRGKSAILSILDYLMMSRSCSIPRGVVRDSVSHVGGLFENENQIRMVVSRTVPSVGQTGSEEIHIQTGYGLELPTAPVDGRWNLKSARNRLSEYAGIEALPLLAREKGGDEDEYAAANIRHAAPFLFQPQDVIASRAVSFPGLEDFWHKRHVLDALDYFIGVFSAELLQLRRELRDLESKQREATRRLRELRRLGADGYDRGQRLLAEAHAVGLAPDARADSIVDLRNLLQSALENEPSPTIDRVTSSLVPSDAIEAESTARARYFSIQHQIGVAQSEAAEAGALTHVTASGLDKISLRSLLPPAHGTTGCPLCGSAELTSTDLDAQLEAAASALGREQEVPRRLHAEMSTRIHRLKEEENAARTEMRAAQRQLRALFEYLSEERTVLEELQARERLRGRIQSYLVATNDLAEHDDDRSEHLILRINEIRNQLATRESHRQRVQRQVEEDATMIAHQLEVEFDEATRVDLQNLAIQIKSGSRWVNLEEFGSGANWVGYHVAGALGLARTFTGNLAPIPRFVVLDQPSQAWFPPEAAHNNGAMPIDSEDRLAVERLYRVLASLGADPQSPQIIVLDHARVAQDWFEKRVIEDWHSPDAALVPSSWIRS